MLPIDGRDDFACFTKFGGGDQSPGIGKDLMIITNLIQNSLTCGIGLREKGLVQGDEILNLLRPERVAQAQQNHWLVRSGRNVSHSPVSVTTNGPRTQPRPSPSSRAVSKLVYCLVARSGFGNPAGANPSISLEFALVRRRQHLCELPFFIGIAEVGQVHLPIS